MIENIQNIYTQIFNELKTYLEINSLYSPFVYKREPNDKKFPVVIMKELYDNSIYTTLKYTDEIYYLDFEINIFAMQKGNLSNMTIANEITNKIEQFFKDNYKVRVRARRDVDNIDPTVFRNIVTVRLKVETKYKDKLIISPR